MPHFDVIIIGAGAAGMMCAIEAGKRGRRVMLIDHNKKPGEKIRISGGGRCNFTNINCRAENFISGNRHFAKSALSQYQPADFVALIERYQLSYQEKTLGQLFCDQKATAIIDMLLNELKLVGVEMRLQMEVTGVGARGDGYSISTLNDEYTCASLVIACGGKSIPKMGASGFGYTIARQFDLAICETRPGLVPLTFDALRLQSLSPLAGLAFDCEINVKSTKFEEAALFTHRGLSGPAILQISSYWREGDTLSINFFPGAQPQPDFSHARKQSGKQAVSTWLSNYFPVALAKFICQEAGVDGRVADLSKDASERLQSVLNNWIIKPAGSEGYRTAEVTLGGVDTNGLNSRTMEAKKQPGLYFIGEVVDVTGWLGGYNFQWAWASGWAAGQVV